MYAVVTCLEQHDPRLVAWAVVICIIAAASGLSAYRRAVSTQNGHRTTWLIILALLLGAGVWATHFMAMLGYQQQLNIQFGFSLTVFSLVLAVGGIGLGAAVAAMTADGRGRALGGAICGISVAAMHFVGVLAIEAPLQIRWNPVLAVLAVVIGICFASSAFIIGGRFDRFWRRMAAIACLVLAIAGLHFTAMAAVTLAPDFGPAVAGAYGSRDLAVGVGLFAALILLAGVGMLAVDRFSAMTALADLRSALASAPAALGFFDRVGRLKFWNDSYGDLLALYEVTPSRGLPFSSIVEAASAHGLEPEIARNALLSQSMPEGSMIGDFEGPDGRWRNASQGMTRDGGFVIAVTDITERRELSRREAEARELAEAANSAKTEFLANMSHEIRTPLNGVLGMVQIMGRHPLDPEQRDRLEVIGEAGRSLLHVLNNVLDISKIEAGRLELEVHPFDLEATVRRATAAYQALADQKEIRFSIEIEPEAHGVWRGDGPRLGQVLSNLVSNALKFTSHGSIELRVLQDESGLCFEVSDTGVGIPADKLDLIFDKFTQADASTTRRFGGTGLGLAICRHYVGLMGGDLKVQSRDGEGSVFSFSLALERDVARPSEPVAPDRASPERDDGRLRILAAEDNATNRLILNALLETFDLDLTMVENGREAVEAYATGPFDLILMDAQMPEMNGLEASVAIRERERATGRARTPIIALTANVMRHQTEAYLAAGMDGFVAKPIEASELMAAIEAALAAPSREAHAA